MRKPNKLLESDVLEAFSWDLLLDPTRIVVKAKDGHVTLSGVVPTYFETTLAEEDAWTVRGVVGVDNDLLIGVAGEAADDVSIAADCAAAIGAEKFVPVGAVTVIVDDGWVTLVGEVRHHYQRQAAAHAIRRVEGVLGVTSKVGITSDPIPSDVVERIQKAFCRNAIINESLIDVTNSGHTIYLDGTTNSWAARREAEDTAWSAPGVTDVVDRLVIVP